MTHNVDIKRMGTDELYKRARQIDQNILIEYGKRATANSDVISQLRTLKQEIIDELKERYYTSNIDKPLKGNLTDDPLAKKEAEDDKLKK